MKQPIIAFATSRSLQKAHGYFICRQSGRLSRYVPTMSPCGTVVIRTPTVAPTLPLIKLNIAVERMLQKLDGLRFEAALPQLSVT